MVDRLLEKVRGHFWAISHEGGDGLPSWALTVGLWHTFGLPELLVCGQDRPGRTATLSQARLALDYGLLQVGQVDREVAWPHVKVGRVDESWHGTGLMRTPSVFYAGALPEYRQLVWADGQGIFPGEEGHAGTPGGQPDLALPWGDHPAGAWRDLGGQA
ncbi:DUF4262 domain-containing protein [Actinomadura scrupuli]|uniref:DUF4262 domain-containing protein n=1 Tax=Actinomadura scrupuli TaxID=559629 RepID=UPI003D99E424